MALEKILAKDIRIEVSLDDITYYEVACAEEGEIVFDTVIAEARCQEDGGAVTKAPAGEDFNASLSGVVSYDDDPLLESLNPANLAFNETKIWFRWLYKLQGRYIKAQGYFGGYTETKGIQDFGRYDVEFNNSSTISRGTI